MTIKGKYFPSQAEGERVFLLIRRHWFPYLVMSIFLLILLTPIVVLVTYWFLNPDVFSGAIGNFMIIFAGIYILIVFGLILYGFINYYLDIYIVTNERIVDIKQNGFFRREIAELHLHQIQDVEAEVDGFFQTMLHFGDIHIQTAGERENFIFQGVPHPYTLAKKITDLHELQLEAEYENQEKEHIDSYHLENYRIKEGEKINPLAEAKISETPNIEVGLSQKEDLEISGQKPTPEEYGFGSHDSISDNQNDSSVKEFSEGEEVSLEKDDKNL